MKVKTFFYAGLATPFIVAALSFPLMFLNNVFALPIAAIWFGGIPYTVLAILMIFAIRQFDELWKLHTLFWSAPLLYLPLLALYWAVYLTISTGQFPELAELYAFMQVMAIFALVLGYAYVTLFSIIYLFVPLSDLGHYNPDHNKGFNRTPVTSGPAKPGKLSGGAG